MGNTFLSQTLRALPFGSRGRRIVDETLNDWELEEAEAAAPADRLLASLRGTGGIVRALAAATALDVLEVRYLPLVTRVVIFTILPPLLLVCLAQSLTTSTVEVTVAQRFWSTVLFLPVYAQMLLPVAFFLALAWPSHRRAPATIGLFLFATIATFAAVAWLVPLSQDAFDRFWWTINLQQHPRAELQHFLPAWSLTALLRKAWSDGAVIGQLPFGLGLAVLAGLSVFAGSRVALGRGRWFRFRLLALVPIYLGALSVLTGAPGAGSLLAYRVIYEPAFRWVFFAAFAAFYAQMLWRHPKVTIPVSAAAGIVVFAVLPADWLDIYFILAGGYSPWILAVVVLLATRRSTRRAICRSEHQSLGQRTNVPVLRLLPIEEDADVRTGRDDAALLRARPGDGRIDHLFSDPLSA